MSSDKTGNILVAKVRDPYNIVINKGSIDGIRDGQRFLVYAIGEEIIDPGTGLTLGRLEIVKGTGRATHVQDSMATIGSDMKRSPNKTIRKIKRSGGGGLAAIYRDIAGVEEVEEVLPQESVPFENVEVGDFIKPI